MGAINTQTQAHAPRIDTPHTTHTYTHTARTDKRTALFLPQRTVRACVCVCVRCVAETKSELARKGHIKTLRKLEAVKVTEK